MIQKDKSTHLGKIYSPSSSQIQVIGADGALKIRGKANHEKTLSWQVKRDRLFGMWLWVGNLPWLPSPT